MTIDNGPWTYECVSPTPEVGQDETPHTYIDIDNGPLTYEYVSPTPEVGRDKTNKKINKTKTKTK